MKKLEIYGTLGPSCKDVDTIEKMLEAGMTGMRLNLSHCNLDDRKDWLNAFHQANKKQNVQADLLIDMKGPELRLAKDDEVTYLPKDSEITLSAMFIPHIILENAENKDILLIDDGKLELEVIENTNGFISCKTIHSGYLKGSKSIAIKGKELNGEVLCESDIYNLKCAKEYGVTGIMQPFVCDKEDLIQVRKVLNEFNLNHLKVYAKIENMKGVKNLETILPYCDHIVIARGDLGNATGLTHLPFVQKQIEETCKKHKKPYMVVTELLSSMIENEIPTRAEVSDIFHAVYHGASSVMLTNETAIGKHPIEAMKVLVEVTKEVKK